MTEKKDLERGVSVVEEEILEKATSVEAAPVVEDEAARLATAAAVGAIEERMELRILSRAEILASHDCPTEIVPTPEWGKGGAVKVQGMSVAQRTNLLSRIRDNTGEIDAEKASLVAFIEGVVEPKFSMKDYDALRQKFSGVIDRVTRKFLELSGLETGALEEARKGFPE